jgi:hypothetical protein
MMEAVSTSETSVNFNRGMIEAIRTSETSVNFNVTTRHYITEDSKLHNRRRENLKSHIVVGGLNWTELAQLRADEP